MKYSVLVLGLVMAVAFLAVLGAWVYCLLDPKKSAKRFSSDIYSADVSVQIAGKLADKNAPATCVVRWSLNERLVTLFFSLSFLVPMQAGGDVKTADPTDARAVIPLMLAPMKCSPRYVSGFGMSQTSDARCFARPHLDGMELEFQNLKGGLEQFDGVCQVFV